MLITEIKPGKHNTYYIFADNEFLFSAYEEIIYKYSIAQGKETQKEVLIKAQKEQNLMYAKKRALDILSRAAVCEKALYNKLLQKGIDKEAAACAVQFAKEYGYVDDEALIKDLILHLAKDKKYGKQRIFSYLYGKGFERELIERSLIEFEDDPVPRIRELILKEKADLDNRAALKKLIAKMQRKGYSFSHIRCALSQITDEEFYEED